jgi:hypothetical protein
MSQFYAESNDEGTVELFYKRTVYNADLSEFGDHIVDFNYAEKILYGRVDRFFLPVMLQDQTKLSSLPGGSGAGQRIAALDFVVTAFKQMNAQFKARSAIGLIRSDDPYLSNLRVVKAYQNPETLYERYQEMFSNVLVRKFENNRITVLDFNIFIESLQNIIFTAEGISRMPFTLPAYIKSRQCPINCTGLAIEIAEFKHSDDDNKFNTFVRSPNWEFYVNAANDHGFMIDRNAPWRLVADINSEGMQTFIRAINPTAAGGTEPFLRNYYKHTHVKYYVQFKRYLLNLYNKVRTEAYTVPTQCKNSRKVGVTISRSKRYNLEMLTREYSEEFFLRLYLKLRFAEEESQYSDAKKHRLVEDCLQVYQSRNLRTALWAFERILNLPFDYNGSMSYYINKVLKEPEDIRFGEIAPSAPSSFEGGGGY